MMYALDTQKPMAFTRRLPTQLSEARRPEAGCSPCHLIDGLLGHGPEIPSPADTRVHCLEVPVCDHSDPTSEELLSRRNEEEAGHGEA